MFSLCWAATGWSQTPEMVAREYIDSMRNADMEKAAALMHPAALERFRDILVQIADALTARDPQADLRKNPGMDLLFGEGGPAELKTTSPAKVFLNFMSKLYARVPMMREMVAGSQVHFIGHVDESENVSHVVYRTTLSRQGTEVTKVEVLSLKRHGENWRVLLTGDLERLATSIGRGAPQ